MTKPGKLLEAVKEVVSLVTECSTCEGTGEDDGDLCPDCDSHIYRIEEWEVAEAVITLKEALEAFENV